jgi:uncharacterized protein (TIGR00645 family)
MSESLQNSAVPHAEQQPSHIVERIIEKTLFSSRWLLAPIYLGLAFSLILILFKFAQKSWAMASKLVSISSDDTIVGVLSLVDLSLMGNLLLMIMFGGYQNFVSQLDFDGHKDKPDWIGHVGFGDLKLKLMASIVAISAIELLKSFMNVEQVSSRDLGWGVGIHMTFVVSAVLLAMMDLLMARVRK